MVKKNKVDQDMEATRKTLTRLVEKRYKRPLWENLKEAFYLIFLAVMFLLFLAVVILLIVILIENPVSLAIICLTIFLIWVWSSR